MRLTTNAFLVLKHILICPRVSNHRGTKQAHLEGSGPLHWDGVKNGRLIIGLTGEEMHPILRIPVRLGWPLTFL